MNGKSIYCGGRNSMRGKLRAPRVVRLDYRDRISGKDVSERQTSRQIGFTGCWTSERYIYTGHHRELRFRAPSFLPFEISLSRAVRSSLRDWPGTINWQRSPFEAPRRDSKRQLRIPGGCEETHKDREGIVVVLTCWSVTLITWLICKRIWIGSQSLKERKMDGDRVDMIENFCWKIYRNKNEIMII